MPQQKIAGPGLSCTSILKLVCQTHNIDSLATVVLTVHPRITEFALINLSVHPRITEFALINLSIMNVAHMEQHLYSTAAAGIYNTSRACTIMKFETGTTFLMLDYPLYSIDSTPKPHQVFSHSVFD